MIPSEIKALVNLQGLGFFNNQIVVIPAEIRALVNLQQLWLGGNQISKEERLAFIRRMKGRGIYIRF